MVATGQLKAPSDWQTERNPVHVAVIGKAGEETAEFSKAAFRAIIQGVDGADPKDGKLNMDALFEELADVRALTLLMEQHFKRVIDPARVREKLLHKLAWLKLIRDVPPPPPGEAWVPLAMALFVDRPDPNSAGSWRDFENEARRLLALMAAAVSGH